MTARCSSQSGSRAVEVANDALWGSLLLAGGFRRGVALVGGH
jgi:hypothetical protein